MSNHLIITLPFIIFGIKLLVLRFAGEGIDEALKIIFALPLELVYSTLAIALTAVNHEYPAFMVRMGVRSTKAAWILVIILIVVAVMFTFFDRVIRKLTLNFAIVVRQIQERTAGGYDWRLADFWVIGRLFWSLIYIMGVAILVGIEVLVSVWLLVNVADLMV